MNTNSKSVGDNGLSNSLSNLMSSKSSGSNSANKISSTFGDAMSSVNITDGNSSSSSVSDYFSSITWQTWVIVILLLALLGINVFAYLAKATTDFSSIFETYFRPILSFFGFGVLETTKQTVSNSATGTKAGVDLVANTTTGAIDIIEDTVRNPNLASASASASANTMNTNTKPTAAKATTSQKNSMPVQQQIQEAGGAYEWNQNALDSALNDAAQTQEPQPDESLSSVQSSSGKAGWCYIGVDRGTRTCSQIGVNDQCLSGDIFPSQEICVNPNLRP
jgi:hypothetical protein